MLPPTWLTRSVRIEFVGAAGDARQTSATLLGRCPVGLLLNIAEAKTLPAWERGLRDAPRGRAGSRSPAGDGELPQPAVYRVDRARRRRGFIQAAVAFHDASVSGRKALVEAEAKDSHTSLDGFREPLPDPSAAWG